MYLKRLKEQQVVFLCVWVLPEKKVHDFWIQLIYVVRLWIFKNKWNVKKKN